MKKAAVGAVADRPGGVRLRSPFGPPMVSSGRASGTFPGRCQRRDNAPPRTDPTLEPPPLPSCVAILQAAIETADLWVALGLAVLSVVLATVEHGWQTLSHIRLLESAEGPSARERLDKLLAHAEKVESALIVLRVGTLIALVMSIMLLFDDASQPGVSLNTLIWTGVSSFLFIIVMCRLLPDELGVDRLQKIVKSTMPMAVGVGRVLDPPIDAVRRALRRLTGHTADDEKEALAGEILSYVEEGEREGHLENEQVQMIEQILELRETEVHKHMTPRTDMDVLDIDATIGEARAKALETGRSRYPLVEEDDVDKVVGIVHVKDLLGHGDGEPVRALAREPWFVPETKFCTALLSEFRDQRAHLAVVLDEYGGTAGIITIEDVLEEIVGEIDDEFDEDEEKIELERIDEHHAVAPGAMHVDELNEAMSISLPESDDWATVGGFIFNTLGRLPEEGETLTHENVRLRVDRVVDRRVERVRVEIMDAAA